MKAVLSFGDQCFSGQQRRKGLKFLHGSNSVTLDSLMELIWDLVLDLRVVVRNTSQEKENMQYPHFLRTSYCG